jgi:zinc transporter
LVATPLGPETQGLICGYRFSGEGTGVPVDLASALAWLESGESGFVWLHFNLSDVGAVPWMRRHLEVPHEFYDALREGSRSTRIDNAKEALVAVVNDVAFEFVFEPSQIETLWVCAGPRLALTARVHALRTIDRLREDVKKGQRFASSIAFLNHLMHDQGDVLARIVREATNKVDVIEDRMLQGRVQNRRAELGTLRRVLVRLQRLLAPEPGAMFRLLRLPPPWVGAPDVEELRQSTEEFSLIIRDCHELQERIRLLQEEIAAQLDEQTNRNLFTLTVVTVLALPMNIVAGLMGMNVGGVPLAQDPHGFHFVVAVVAGVTALGAWLAFRKRD